MIIDFWVSKYTNVVVYFFGFLLFCLECIDCSGIYGLCYVSPSYVYFGYVVVL